MIFFVNNAILPLRVRSPFVSAYKPAGDQPQAVGGLVRGIEADVPYQTLLGVTGSGKTFTVAGVIERVQKTTFESLQIFAVI